MSPLSYLLFNSFYLFLHKSYPSTTLHLTTLLQGCRRKGVTGVQNNGTRNFNREHGRRSTYAQSKDEQVSLDKEVTFIHSLPSALLYLCPFLCSCLLPPYPYSLLSLSLSSSAPSLLSLLFPLFYTWPFFSHIFQFSPTSIVSSVHCPQLLSFFYLCHVHNWAFFLHVFISLSFPFLSFLCSFMSEGYHWFWMKLNKQLIK